MTVTENGGDSLELGDVALDLTQGRPVQLVGEYDGDAAAWSEEYEYDLCGNYGNTRLDAEPGDRVFDAVYVSNIKSEPSKTYAFPESRLARIEVENASEELRRPAAAIRQAFLIEILTEFKLAESSMPANALIGLLKARSLLDEELIDEAQELAEIEAETSNESDTNLGDFEL